MKADTNKTREGSSKLSEMATEYGQESVWDAQAIPGTVARDVWWALSAP